ncbi:MAG: superoxide dismutase family protein [Clostridia bacterium]
MKTALGLALAGVLLAGCQTMQQGPRAHAELQPTKGNTARGEATFVQTADNQVRVTVTVDGLKPGSEHGFHIHEAGDCSAPDAMSAKGHFNPAGKPHGHPSMADHHAGDLPALKADAGGRATAEATLQGISISAGAASILGRGLIVHADPDDYKTQPTGNSGARIACGVIQAG